MPVPVDAVGRRLREPAVGRPQLHRRVAGGLGAEDVLVAAEAALDEPVAALSVAGAVQAGGGGVAKAEAGSAAAAVVLVLNEENGFITL